MTNKRPQMGRALVVRLGVLIFLLSPQLTFGLQSDPDITALIEAIRDQNVEIRIPAINQLVQYGAAAVPKVSQILSLSIANKVTVNEEAAFRADLARVLAEIGPEAKSAAPVLIELLRDQSLETSEAALSALIAIEVDPQYYVPTVKSVLIERKATHSKRGNLAKMSAPEAIKLLTNADPKVRSEAANFLGDLSADAEGAVDALIRSLSDEDLLVRNSAAAALAAIAEDLQDKRQTEAIQHLDAMQEALERSGDPLVRDRAVTVRRAREYLTLVLKDSTSSRFWEFVAAHRTAQIVLGLLGAAVSINLLWVTILVSRPLWLLGLGRSFRHSIKVPGVELSISLRQLTMLSFYEHRPRVLDAWVRKNIQSVRSSFNELPTVDLRSLHIDIPVQLRGETVMLEPEHLRSSFLKNQPCILIHGEGGSGKTSLACQIAKWAMAAEKDHRLTKHLMLPVLMEEEIRASSDEDNLVDAIQGQLQVLTGIGAGVNRQLTVALLKSKRVLLVLDRYSEMTAETRGCIRPQHVNFQPRAMIVTSRFNERLSGIAKTTLRPTRLDAAQLVQFIQTYSERKKGKNFFDTRELLNAAQRLLVVVGRAQLTILFAKLYVEHMMAVKEASRSFDRATNIPELVLAYINEINVAIEENHLPDLIVHRAMKTIAWESIRQTGRPAPVDRDSILKLVGRLGEGEKILDYLEHRLNLVRSVVPAKNQIIIALDPLAEYLAALHLIELCKTNGQYWDDWLKQADLKIENHSEFLIALYHSYAVTSQDEQTRERLSQLDRIALKSKAHTDSMPDESETANRPYSELEDDESVSKRTAGVTKVPKPRSSVFKKDRQAHFGSDVLPQELNSQETLRRLDHETFVRFCDFESWQTMAMVGSKFRFLGWLFGFFILLGSIASVGALSASQLDLSLLILAVAFVAFPAAAWIYIAISETNERSRLRSLMLDEACEKSWHELSADQSTQNDSPVFSYEQLHLYLNREIERNAKFCAVPSDLATNIARVQFNMFFRKGRLRVVDQDQAQECDDIQSNTSLQEGPKPQNRSS